MDSCAEIAGQEMGRPGAGLAPLWRLNLTPQQRGRIAKIQEDLEIKN